MTLHILRVKGPPGAGFPIESRAVTSCRSPGVPLKQGTLNLRIFEAMPYPDDHRHDSSHLQPPDLPGLSGYWRMRVSGSHKAIIWRQYIHVDPGQIVTLMDLASGSVIMRPLP